MSLNPATLRASSAYRKIHHESRAAAADPVELVSMLYEELETTLGVLTLLARKGQPFATTEQAHRVRMMLIALDAGLDHQAGGQLATTLSGIYHGMRSKLDRAATAGDPAAVDEMAAGVASLHAAWSKISRPAV